MNHPVTKLVLAAALLAVPILANAQASNEPRTPVDGGAIIIPPETDRKAIKPAPKNVDPEAVKPAPGNVEPGTATQAEKTMRTKRATQPAVGKKRSKEADCKGPAELCKQDSPK